MRRCIAVMVAALAVAWCAPLAAQAPEQSRPAEGGNAKPPIPLRRSTETLPHAAPRPLPVAVERIEAVSKDSIRALDLQTEFPRKIEPVRVPIPSELIWIGLIIAAALILYALRDSLPFLLRGARDWETDGAGAGESALARRIDALAAADALSREGRFVEAMHMLLLQGLTDIREHSREPFADSLTSREILRGARLSAEGRTSLRAIIAAVERTYFGGYPAEPGDYAACRQNFDGLRRALQDGAPA